MIKKMKDEMLSHLNEDIVPFWTGLMDREYGGFYGLLTYDLRLDKKAVKGCILNSRILWFFSNLILLERGKNAKSAECAADINADAEGKKENRNPEIEKACRQAYDFLKKSFLDKENGGVYWSVEYDGEPADETKHTYNQAFAIYALASYFDASGNKEAMRLAYELRRIVEDKCRDKEGYLEAFTADFRPAGNEKLSENGVEAHRTMNTLLHVYEAYTEYLRVIKAELNHIKNVDPAQDTDRPEKESMVRAYGFDLVAEREAVENDIRFILDIIADKIYNPVLKRQEVFFGKDYNSLIDLHSYGHDIETSWLVDRGLDILDDKAYTEKIRPINSTLAEKIYERAYVDHSLLNECEKGVDDTTRVWWVQAEAVLGFMNAASKSRAEGDEEGAKRYEAAAVDVWEYIKDKLIDKRPGSEWFSQVDKDGNPDPARDIVEPWKCPYHNGRMCIYLQMM
ncbi:MAG: AGE family epimerase/isomerase [Lachnospiraceae bacterium]|nr:AGE family epimerase/isomerase [Lachnospiraceae bacterium]